VRSILSLLPEGAEYSNYSSKKSICGRSSGFLYFNAFPPLTPPGAGTVAKDVEKSK